MKLFVVVTFDLVGGTTAEYESIKGELQTAGLTKLPKPENTFWGETSRYASVESAILGIEKKFHLVARVPGSRCEGTVFVTAFEIGNYNTKTFSFGLSPPAQE